MPDAVQTIRRTTYKSENVTAAGSGDALRTIVKRVEGGRYNMNIDTIFRMDEIVLAHRRMEKNEATGKMVVVVD
jgi:NADPH:quinone reductase-like Zn-dependent oxidoreductase